MAMEVNYDLDSRKAYQAKVEDERVAKVAAKQEELETLAGAMSDIKLLVAVATKGSGLINEHFGHAKEFQVYELSTAGTKFVGHRRVDLYCQGGDGDEENLETVIRAINDCHAVFVAKIGGCPKTTCSRRASSRSIISPMSSSRSRKRPEDFSIPVEGQRARVIEALDGQLVTGERVVAVEARDGLVMTDVERDILKITLVDRYGNTPPSVALVTNFGLKQGAIASSVSHDSHNVVAVGVSDEELARAVNGVIEAGGGLAIADRSGVAVLPLPLAGLMSDADGYHVAAEYHRFDRMAKDLGSQLTAPFMTLSFMALLVFPR